MSLPVGMLHLCHELSWHLATLANVEREQSMLAPYNLSQDGATRGTESQNTVC